MEKEVKAQVKDNVPARPSDEHISILLEKKRAGNRDKSREL